jgi:hypothetical protein
MKLKTETVIDSLPHQTPEPSLPPAEPLRQRSPVAKPTITPRRRPARRTRKSTTPRPAGQDRRPIKSPPSPQPTEADQERPPIKPPTPHQPTEAADGHLSRSLAPMGPVLPAVIKRLKPPVLPGEKQADFNRLLDDLARHHLPATITAWLLLFELAGNYLTELRFRRAQTALFLAEAMKAHSFTLPAGFSAHITRDEKDKDIPPPPKPVLRKPSRRARDPIPSQSEMAKALTDKIDIFTGSEAIITALGRRRDRLLQQLRNIREAGTPKFGRGDDPAENRDG